MRQLIVPTLLSILLIPGCGGGGSRNGIPAAASEMDAELKSSMARFIPMVSNVESSLIFVLNAGSPMAQGVTVAPDATPGAPPHTVTFSGPYDGNGDGFNETTISGRATFNSDPVTAWSGLSGQATTDVSIPLLGHLYHSDVTFTIQSDRREISGSGTFTQPITGDTTTMTVSAGEPLVIKAAGETADAVSNACGYSLSGQIRLDVTGSDGTLTSYWNFNPTSPSVAVNGASFTDSSGTTTALPDSSVTLTCGSGGNINDWVGSFDHFWACLPYEWGHTLITIAVAGPDTIAINSMDAPASAGRSTAQAVVVGDSDNYQATVVGANTHAVIGAFIGGPDGIHYREDFNWTLRGNGSAFSQVSRYEFIEGPNTGNGGICVARAQRMP